MTQAGIIADQEKLIGEVTTNRGLIMTDNSIAINANNWHTSLIIPFGDAYAEAHNRLQHQLNKLELARKQSVEIALFAVSLCGGTAFTAVFGRLTIGKFLQNHALRFVCERNMKKTFDVMAAAEGSAVLEFILGHSSTQLETWAGAGVRNALKDLYTSVDGMQFILPSQVQNALEGYYKKAENVVRDAFRDIGIYKGLESEQVKSLSKIRNSPFCLAPTSRAVPAHEILTDRIELSFYLKMLLDSDYEYYYAPKGASSRTRINIMPSNRDYPPQFSPNKGPHGMQVQFDNIGDNIAKRINELYRKSNVVRPGGNDKDLVYDGLLHNGATYSGLKKAEQVLNQLGDMSAANARQVMSGRKKVQIA